MSTLSVAKKDLTGARRSRALWIAGVALSLIAVMVIYARAPGFGSGHTEVQRLFVLLTQILAVLLPIVALAASYVAIAGEREGGGIKFLLSLPNTRWDVYAGTLLSRLVVVAVGVGFMFLAATSMSLTKYGAVAGGVIVGSFVLTVVYGSVFVSVAVAMSAMAASRSRAIAGALAAYFGLVVLYVVPVVSIQDMARWLHHSMLGLERNPDLYNAVRYTSPYLAYQKAMNLVVPAGLERRFFMDSATNVDQSPGRGPPGSGSGVVDPELPTYLTDEFSLVVLSFWLVVPLLVGYWAFDRAELE